MTTPALSLILMLTLTLATTPTLSLNPTLTLPLVGKHWLLKHEKNLIFFLLSNSSWIQNRVSCVRSPVALPLRFSGFGFPVVQYGFLTRSSLLAF